MTLPADWPEQREALRRIATYVLARARYVATGRVSLEPTAGGFGTPTFVAADGAFRRLRITSSAGAYLVDEHIAAHGATTRYIELTGTSLDALADATGVDLDGTFSVGHDAVELGDPGRPISVAPWAVSTIGDWYALGSIAIDRAISGSTARAPSVARIWPEHFDLGTDVEVAPGRRCNLGASAGDEAHPAPYLYVGPWGDERPGDDGYWNAPFGAVRGFADVVANDDPQLAATAFFHDGIDRLGA